MALAPASYPQSRSQKPGLGNPLCRMAGIVCLGSGVLLDAAIGRYRGKGGDEQSLLKPDWMTQTDYDRAPDVLKVRELLAKILQLYWY